MVASIRITKRVVDGMKPGETIWDTDVKGFAVRRQARAKVYLLKTRVNGRQRWFSIGEHGTPWTPETARREAQRLWGEIRSGTNLIAIREARRDQPTVSELCERFLDEYARPHKKPLSLAADERNIANHIKPLLGSRTVAELTRNDIDDFKRKVAEGRTARPAVPISKGGRGGLPVTGGPGAANRTLALLSKMFSMAEQWGWRPDHSNPCHKIVRYAENKNERFLSSAEISRLGGVLDALDRDRRENLYATAAIRILLLTGARLSEIIWLQWQHVDLERGLLHLPDSKTGKRPVFLNKLAIQIIDRLQPKPDNPFVFASDMPGRPIQSIQHVWQRVRVKADLKGVRIHDLRHSFASLAAANGASLPLIGRMLGHSTPLTTQRYAHLVNDPVRDANDAVGATLARLLNPHFSAGCGAHKPSVQ
ncbi:MAG: site-specific integrase [Alphaproteobacteria bacterium]|nr:site-specific integrase [Alphaproteobacteria bacterium]